MNRKPYTNSKASNCQKDGECDYTNYWEEEWAKREARHYYEKLYGQLKHRLTVAPHARILDVGGGDGHLMHFLNIKNADIIDISDSGLAKAATCGFGTIKADIQKRFPISPCSYDVCFCFEVLEHLHFPEITIAETFKALKADGILYVGQPNMRADGVHHVRRYYHEDIERELKQAGFVIEWCDYVPGFIMRDSIWDDIRKSRSLFRKIKQSIALLISLLPRSVLYGLARMIPNRFCLIFVIKARKG